MPDHVCASSRVRPGVAAVAAVAAKHPAQAALAAVADQPGVAAVGAVAAVAGRAGTTGLGVGAPGLSTMSVSFRLIGLTLSDSTT